jgi:tetratricopeptide (TPR) repeat protein
LGGADVGERLVVRPPEFPGNRRGRAHAEPGHRPEEIRKPIRVGIEARKEVVAVLDLVLRQAALEGLRQVAPERIRPRVGDLQDAAHVSLLVPVQEQAGRCGVGIGAEPSLRGAEIARAQRKRPDNLGAYDLYLQALPHAYAQTSDGRTLALALLDKALAVDPNYAEAHGLAAWCHLQRVLSESPDLSADMASSLAHAKAVMALRTDDASTLAFAAVAYTGATKDFETAVQMTDHALARNPSNTHALTFGAAVNAWAGRLDLTVPLAERALRCSPFDPLGYVAWAAIARARLVQGEAEAALAAARRAVQTNPGHLPSHGYVLICLVRLGRAQELEAALERIRRAFPVRLAHFTAHRSFGLFDAELKAVGLPE